MRTITVRRGNFKGEHIIYDSVQEAIANERRPKLPWHSPDVVVGDWVIADDGYVVQCLSKVKLVNKRHRNGQYTDCFRFAQGTFGVYIDAKGERHITRNFYAMVSNGNKSSMGNTPSIGRYMPIKKREFVMWMSMGIDPYTAFIKAFKPYNKNTNYITMQINRLLVDEQVKGELMEAMKTFVDEIQTEVQETSGYTDLKQLLVKKTARLLTKDHKNDQTELIVLKFAFEFLGQQVGAIAPDNKGSGKKQIQEAEFTVMSPPALGS